MQKTLRLSFMAGLAFFTAIALFFFKIVPPTPLFAEASLNNLLLISSIAFPFILVFLIKGSALFFEVDSKRELFEDVGLGLVWGVIGLFLVSFIVTGFNGFYNLFGTIQFSGIASFNFFDALGVIFIQPITETFLLTALVLMLSFTFKSIKIPFPFIWAIALTSAFFGLLHFTVLGAQFYEYSAVGFFQFLSPFDSTIGTALYHGGFPQLLMGFIWGSLIVYYKSFIVPLIAHVVNNFSFAFLGNFLNNEVLLPILVVVFALSAIGVYAFYKFGLGIFIERRAINLFSFNGSGL